MPFNQHDLLRQAGYQEGDRLPLATPQVFDNVSSTTSTTYSATGGAPDRVVFDTADYPFDTFEVQLGTRLDSDTAGETAFAQLRDERNDTDYPGSEVSATGTAITPRVGPRVTIQDTGILDFLVLVRSSDGAATATVRGAQINLWGVLE